MIRNHNFKLKYHDYQNWNILGWFSNIHKIYRLYTQLCKHYIVIFCKIITLINLNNLKNSRSSIINLHRRGSKLGVNSIHSRMCTNACCWVFMKLSPAWLYIYWIAHESYLRHSNLWGKLFSCHVILMKETSMHLGDSWFLIKISPKTRKGF